MPANDRAVVLTHRARLAEMVEKAEEKLTKATEDRDALRAALDAYDTKHHDQLQNPDQPPLPFTGGGS